MSEVTANYDESWKEALNEYFDSFLAFFFPKVYELRVNERTGCKVV